MTANSSSESMKPASPDNSNSGDAANLKSNLSDTCLAKKDKKKKVIWADSCAQQLEKIQYFYLDETEKGKSLLSIKFKKIKL